MNNSFSPDDSLDIGQIFRILMMQSKLIILISFLGFSLGIYNHLTTDKTFRITSLLQITAGQSNPLNDVSLGLFTQGANTSDIGNVEMLYKSRTNVKKVVEQMKLNVRVDNPMIDRSLLFNKIKLNGKNDPNEKFILQIGDKDYSLIIGDSITKDMAFQQDYNINGITINIAKIVDLFGSEISFRFIEEEKAINSLISSMQVKNNVTTRSFYQRNNGLIEVSIIAQNTEEAKKVLNFYNDTFIDQSVEIESKKARKAINFIDQRADAIREKLELEKTNLQRFQEVNKSVNVELEIESILQNLNAVEKRIAELDVEIATASNTFTPTNPILIDLEDQKNALYNQKLNIEQKIKSLPIAQQEYVDLYRDIQIDEEVYSELLSKKIEFSIKEASTLGNIRIVDTAYVDSKVSPQAILIIIITFLFFLISIIGSIIRGVFFIPVSNPAELADRAINQPILGVVPLTEENSDNDVENEKHEQSLQSLIVNLNTTIENKETNNQSKTILITSPTPQNGKSYIARELSKSLQQTNKKVLLIDIDMKRGDQHKSLGREKISLKDFRTINIDNLDKLKITENFYFIPKVSRLNNSFQFLYSEEFINKLELFKKNFDYIIIDTAPILSVSDTAMLMGHSDVNLAIVRHGLTKINEIKQMVSIASQIGIDFDGFVYNAYQKPSSYYGYYGFYGNYSYQYYAQKYLYENYDYDKEN